MLVDLSYDNSVATLKLNNPKKLNALSCDFISEIYEKITNIEASTKVLIITGCEKAFAAGVDVSKINSLSYEDAYLKDFIDYKWEAIFNIRIPVIAAISGYALGGGFELALMCDVIVAAKNAVFGFPEVNLGIMPGMGGTQILPKIVGPKIASEIMMTGRFISAEEAVQLKIVSYLTEEQDLLKESMKLATKIAEKSTMSTQIIKEAIRMSQNVGLYQGIKSERQMFRSLFSTSYKEEGIAEFLNKKK